LLGTCTEANNTPLGENIYCLDHVQVYLECFEPRDCSAGKTCTNNRCVDSQ